MVECKATNMKDKQHLQELSLWWDDKRDDGETECYDEMSLEGLQPHPNLKLLKLYSYMGVRIPSWISSLTNLGHFDLYYNKRLQHLPPLNQLPFLKIRNLTSLKELEIWGCPLLGQRCKRQIGEDWPFIAHVPRVYVDNQMIQNQREETISPNLLQNIQALQLCSMSQNCKRIVRICRKQFLQNQLRQRTSLGAKFRPYSKTAIVQQVKNS
ncbi:putative disease resistance protein rga4, partial [Quercus suber]